MLAEPETWSENQPTKSDWRCRWRLFRNRLMADKRFQRWCARTPFFKKIANKKAIQLHHITAGFVYSQTLAAVVQSNLLAILHGRIESTPSIADKCGLTPPAMHTLLTAARALKLVDEISRGFWMVGELGASVLGNPAVSDMVKHHTVLYRDMTDPLRLLQQREQTGLRDYWSYVPGGRTPSQGHSEYSQLMSSSIELISDHILEAYSLKNYQSLIDVAGGTGNFTRLAKKRWPHISTVVLDLPEVVSEAKALHLDNQTKFVPTDMFHSPLPQDAELFSLIRVVHDHDDAPVIKLLRRIFEALRPGGNLLIAEPMAGTSGAEPIGDTYFSFYLWAMGSGRPRTPQEIIEMCMKAGFSKVQEVKTPIPALTKLLIAEK